MSLAYKSTRGKEEVSSAEAIVKGIAADGGLFVPTYFPKLDMTWKELAEMNYQKLAFYLIKKFFTDFTDSELLDCVVKAYDDKFTNPAIAPLCKKAGAHFLELYHGPTLAFKDMALSILPHLLKTSQAKLKLGKEIVILTATSGDTGKAALEGFADVEGTKIIVFYPQNGVSEIQKRQMLTQKGKNTFVIGLEGNFDDAQTGVKELFTDNEFKELLAKHNYMFSSANSINIGRLVPQIVYYFSAYLDLLKNAEIVEDEKINIVVPTGNFGNILAAYYAKKMGLPVHNLICASNENNVLTDFLSTGVYDIHREFKTTSSPSMDILISSNLERLLYDLSFADEKLVRELMQNLKEAGRYEITSEMKDRLDCFSAGFASQEETLEAIREIYESAEYVIDTHTAVAYAVYQKYCKDTKDLTKTIIASTASPFKFPQSVSKALFCAVAHADDFELIKRLAQFSGMEIPAGIKDLDKREIRHNQICSKAEMQAVVKKILKV